MLETSPDTEVSFFVEFARVVQESGLTPAQIARRANERIKETIDVIPDPVDRMFMDIATPRLHPRTVERAVSGETSVSKETFSRIVMGLDKVDPKTYNKLEKLREAERHVHHSTKSRAITKNGKNLQLPKWLDEEQPV